MCGLPQDRGFIPRSHAQPPQRLHHTGAPIDSGLYCFSTLVQAEIDVYAVRSCQNVLVMILCVIIFSKECICVRLNDLLHRSHRIAVSGRACTAPAASSAITRPAWPATADHEPPPGKSSTSAHLWKSCIASALPHGGFIVFSLKLDYFTMASEPPFRLAAGLLLWRDWPSSIGSRRRRDAA